VSDAREPEDGHLPRPEVPQARQPADETGLPFNGVPPTVRSVTFDLLRSHGLTTIFGNPGSTELAFLGELPADFRYVLALHEGAAVGMATGHAQASGEPALVNVHTAAGLGNAVSALSTARLGRAPLVVIVGQQDRRHLALEPFLSGELTEVGGAYVKWATQPARAQDVPGALNQALHIATQPPYGPTVVVVPQDDWKVPYDEPLTEPHQLVMARDPDAEAINRVVSALETSVQPVIVAGAGADEPSAWAALVDLAERLGAPVYAEAFGSRAGFPQDHPQFAGHLPTGRAQVVKALDGHDLVLAVGAPVFRHYQYEPGPVVPHGASVLHLSDDPEEAARTKFGTSVLCRLAPLLRGVARRLPRRTVAPPSPRERRRFEAVAGEPLRPEHVLTLLADRLPEDAVLVEETPSSRPLLHELVPARSPLGFVSAAGGGLGYAMAAAIGIRMAAPSRPVVAVVGDGSSVYGIQALWSAVRYRVPAIFIVLANNGYAVLNRLARGSHGVTGELPWPEFGSVSISTLAAGFGCPAVVAADMPSLRAALEDGLAERDQPLLIEVPVEADRTAFG
jgi:benzoylformate decarboxylase